jgi:hypothetical protein
LLAVVRFDDPEGSPIAVLVNFAAHPVITDAKLLRYAADYPGFLRRKVEAGLKTRCVFMRGAAGDMSPNPVGRKWEPKGFGETVADHVIALVRSIRADAPVHPSVKGMVDSFHFKTRVDLKDPRVASAFERSYFPEITRAYVKLYGDSLAAELNTVLLNGEIALVGGSEPVGEPASNDRRGPRDRVPQAGRSRQGRSQLGVGECGQGDEAAAGSGTGGVRPTTRRPRTAHGRIAPGPLRDPRSSGSRPRRSPARVDTRQAGWIPGSRGRNAGRRSR